MKNILRMTVKEAHKTGYWEEYCRQSGCSVWASNEGLISNDEIIEIECPIKVKEVR